jgi:hypothetical protein
MTLLAWFSDHPAKIHFDALRRLARYLRMTKDWGLFYWRPKAISSLPAGTTFTILKPDAIAYLNSHNLQPLTRLLDMSTQPTLPI